MGMGPNKAKEREWMNPSGSPGWTQDISVVKPVAPVQSWSAPDVWQPPRTSGWASGFRWKIFQAGRSHSGSQGQHRALKNLLFSVSGLELGWSRSSFHNTAFTAGFVLAKLTRFLNLFFSCYWGFFVVPVYFWERFLPSGASHSGLRCWILLPLLCPSESPIPRGHVMQN